VPIESSADSELGQKYYVIYMKEETGLKGSVFTKQHTQAEWKALFDHKGEKFATEYSKKYPALKAFLKSVDFQEFRIDIRDFCIEYASDTMGIAAGC
jgi:hypothetical protein